MTLGNKYTEKEAAAFHREHSSNNTYRMGVTADGDWFIRFAQYELWQTKEEFKKLLQETGSGQDGLYLCRRTPEGYLSNAPVQVASFHDKSRRKSASYYTRDTKATRDAKKWGYRPEG